MPVQLIDESNEKIEFDIMEFSFNYKLYFKLDFNGFGSTRVIKV